MNEKKDPVRSAYYGGRVEIWPRGNLRRVILAYVVAIGLLLLGLVLIVWVHSNIFLFAFLFATIAAWTHAIHQHRHYRKWPRRKIVYYDIASKYPQ